MLRISLDTHRHTLINSWLSMAKNWIRTNWHLMARVDLVLHEHRRFYLAQHGQKCGSWLSMAKNWIRTYCHSMARVDLVLHGQEDSSWLNMAKNGAPGSQRPEFGAPGTPWPVTRKVGAIVIWLSLLIHLPMLCSSYSHQSSHSPCHHFVIILK